MKLWTKNLTILFLMSVILLAGCTGCGQETAPEHADPYNQAAFGPVAANSRVPVSELPPFEEPSFERLIAQFMVDVANKVDDTSVMRNRKREVIDNPDLLWKPGYIVPERVYDDAPDLINIDPFKDKIKILPHDQKGKPISERVSGHPSIKSGTVLPFTGKIFYTTKDQETRLSVVEKHWRGEPILTDDYYREKYEIMLEGIDPLIAAKYLRQSIKNERMIKDTTLIELGIEYAFRAMQKNPNSVDAMHVWVRCHKEAHQLGAYRQLLKKFPNAAFAHEHIASVYFKQGDIEFALEHIQKACQLDSRIEKKNTLLAKCYAKLGKWEQSIAAYQGLSWVRKYQYIGDHIDGLDSLDKAQRSVYRQQKGYSYGVPLEPVAPIDFGYKENKQ